MSSPQPVGAHEQRSSHAPHVVQSDRGELDARPSDRAGPLRVGLVSLHTSPLEQAGSGDAGGMNVYLDALGRELVRAGAAVDVFTRAGGGDLPPTVRTADGVAVHHLQAGPPGLAKDALASYLCAFWLAFAAHPRAGRLDVLHGHYWLSGWIGRRARRHLGIPMVQTFHTLARAKNANLAPGERPEPALRTTAEDRVVAEADAVIAPTLAEATLLRSAYRAHPGLVHVVEPGVDMATFTAPRNAAAARRDLGGGRIILHVGRLQPLKGPDVAVRTLAALVRGERPGDVPIRLVVVGGPSGSGGGLTDAAALRSLATELGVADRLAVLAPRPHAELAALYAAADVVVVPSRSESFGLVALEAQASGTPVVAAEVGGLVHAVGEGAGRLVAGYDPLDWARAVRRYLDDPAAAAAAAERGRAHASRFGWGRTAARTLEVYREARRAHAAATGPALTDASIASIASVASVAAQGA